ncbi:MAG TPA: hypothetical protein VE954_13860 [Oligoflexus sp.]|uniref:hypothetical protein n=1 Tax=Oligoflexus sp. TaxID=1971216 RepID=UPI002D3611EF|nr:hypothetical protein [Oligoflexus sp.]HYX34185.1 hypothetical protein [Oligoflexus sp.]
MVKLMNDLRKFVLLAAAATVVSCGAPTLTKKRIELDPEVEAKVRQINLERYAGSWLMTLARGTIYLEISADGYYMTADNKTSQATFGDFGTIAHYKPGYMLLYSDRTECGEDGTARHLKMDRNGDTIEATDSIDRSLTLNLVAVDKRDHIETLSCIR